ncbi:MAG: hypothetical protein V3U37_04295, partial [Nitrospinaceae bacterium]
AFSQEPKRFNQKLELLERGQKLLPQTGFANPQIAQQFDRDIRKTKSELEIYNEALKVPRRDGLDKQTLIIRSDAPEYFLDVAQKRAAAYFQEKYELSKQAKTAQHFSGAPRKFEPDNKDIQKEFPGACGPFMNARTNALHLMLPFDLKISRKPDDPLDAILRIFYAKMGYSFPLCYEMGKLCSQNDGQVVDIELDDPNLLFVSASPVKEREFRFRNPDLDSRNIPPEYAYPVTVLERTGTLGPFVQIVTNFQVWFDASVVSLLVHGAPDLHEYGLSGGMGLMIRSHAADKVPAYADARKEAWQEGLSFNFVNIHLQLNPGTDTAFVPYNTPLFTFHPTLNRQSVKIKDYNKVSKRG